MKRNEIHVPMGACPPNPVLVFIPIRRVVQLSIDMGPLPLCWATPPTSLPVDLLFRGALLDLIG